MHPVGERDGLAQPCGFEHNTLFQGLQLVLEGMDRRFLDVPVLVPKAFERHKSVERFFPSPFCRQPMHRGQGVEHEVRTEVKMKPFPFHVLAACLDMLVLRGEARLHVQKLVPFQPFWHRGRGGGGWRRRGTPMKPPPGEHPSRYKGENHGHACEHVMEGRGEDERMKV